MHFAATTSLCQPGDIWKLGEKHLVACMDSTELTTILTLFREQTPSLILADPPYGIALLRRRGRVGKGGRLYDPVIGDESTETAIRSFQLCQHLFPYATQIWWGANYYCHILPPSPCWIVWDKEARGLSFADAEVAWVNSRDRVRVVRHTWSGARRASEQGEQRVHPMQKPVALARWCLEKFSHAGDLIFDPFLGSGISILAAEGLGGERTVIGCELSPVYCAITMQRFTALTGIEPVLLHRVEEPLLALAV